MEQTDSERHLRIPVFFVGIFAGLSIAAVVFLLLTGFFVAKPSSDKTANAKAFQLALTSPYDNLATSQKLVKIEGLTGSEAVVSVVTASETKTLETQNAKFSLEVGLKEGKNIINITAFDLKTGESQSVSREVLYLQEELTNL